MSFMRIHKGHFIGFLVFGVGVVLLGAVGFIGLQKFTEQDDSAQQDITIAVEGVEASILMEAPESAARPVIKREIVGQWANQRRDMVLSLNAGQYDLIILASADGLRRFYSRGQYVYDPDTHILRLMPDPRMAAPEVRSSETYRILTMQTYDIHVRSDSAKNMVWLPWGKEGKRDQFHPVFTQGSAQNSPVIWSVQ